LCRRIQYSPQQDRHPMNELDRLHQEAMELWILD